MGWLHIKMIFWNVDLCNTIFVNRPFPILIDEFSPWPAWIRIRMTLTSAETSLFYVFWKFTHHVSSWFVSAHNIGTSHSVLFRFSSPNAKLSTSFPHYLCEVTRASWKSTASEIIARITQTSLYLKHIKKLNEREIKIWQRQQGAGLCLVHTVDWLIDK